MSTSKITVMIVDDSAAVRAQVGAILSRAAGMEALREAGAATLGQDERTSVVYGMARAARERGAVERELPLDRLPHALLQAAARAVAVP